MTEVPLVRCTPLDSGKGGVHVTQEKRIYPTAFKRRRVELVRAARGPEEFAREFEPSANTIRSRRTRLLSMRGHGSRRGLGGGHHPRAHLGRLPVSGHRAGRVDVAGLLTSPLGLLAGLGSTLQQAAELLDTRGEETEGKPDSTPLLRCPLTRGRTTSFDHRNAHFWMRPVSCFAPAWTAIHQGRPLQEVR